MNRKVIIIIAIIIGFAILICLVSNSSNNYEPEYFTQTPPIQSNSPSEPAAFVVTNYTLVSNDLDNNNTLSQGQSLVQGDYKLLVQSDGNLALYDSSQTQLVVWSTNTTGQGTPPYSMTLQTDGNLCLYDSTGKSLWCSNTANKGKGPWTAILQTDRNFCIYDSNNTAQWCTMTQK
ncbi:mannose-specific lectin [Tupanvirus deep ocean]|uniref:Mannose-specific lectin n=2 Tax=Tupanvirus TaxID=2094720 RepID=A0AC62A6L9_9VIRU|nr:mannose-specific lectin [Tupanvirus deep ocean]QKU33430.1 mannose-specific lectin [Tupanvirus deep ocean]